MLDERSVRVYKALASLPRMNHATPSLLIPDDGVYFFFESGESVTVDEVTRDRVVRVGINTSGILADRLHEHFSETGISIFKWHVCCALLSRDCPGHVALHTERPYLDPNLRPWVCEYMRQSFTYVCVRVEDGAERERLEKGLIALLAQRAIGAPSSGWLGHYAVRPYREGRRSTGALEPNREIRASGLWNVQHVNGTPLCERDLVLLEHLIEDTRTRRGRSLS